MLEFKIEIHESYLFQFIYNISILGDVLMYYEDVDISFDENLNKWIVYGTMNFR
jgi:hypothetical protein